MSGIWGCRKLQTHGAERHCCLSEQVDIGVRGVLQVKYVKDIAPVLSEYSRYKHIKAILKELQGSGL